MFALLEFGLAPPTPFQIVNIFLLHYILEFCNLFLSLKSNTAKDLFYVSEETLTCTLEDAGTVETGRGTVLFSVVCKTLYHVKQNH